MSELPFDIGIVSSEHRQPLITKYLDDLGLNYNLSNTPDYPYDDSNLVGNWNNMNCNPIGAYRAFRGHQKVLSESTKDYTLVFEYDAVPATSDWLDYILKYYHYVNDYGLIFWHMRATPTKFTIINDQIAIANDIAIGQVVGGITVKKGLGALAYIVNKETKEKILNEKFTGIAYDILLTNKYKFNWFSEPNLFYHNQEQGSLTDTNA